jgi:YVTN family beta-propeller protein
MADSESRRFTHPGRLVVAVVGILVLGVLLGVGGVKAAHHFFGTPPPGPVAQASAGYGLDVPSSATVAGADLFVANEGGNSVTVVDASTGAHVTTITGAPFGFDQPTAIVAVGPDLFVANGAANSVTELDSSTRTVVRIISGAQFGFADPIALAAGQGRLYVLSAAGPVTAVSTATGDLAGIASGAQFGFSTPLGIAVSGNNVFVTNSATDSVVEINGQTMALIRQIQGAEYKFKTPTGAVIEGSNLWVTNQAGDSVTELATSTGKLVRVVVDTTNLPTPGPIIYGDGYVFTVSPPGDSPMVSQITPADGWVAWMMCNTNGAYLFSNPQAAAVSGSNLWVVSKGSSSLTEMDTDSGKLIRTIS